LYENDGIDIYAAIASHQHWVSKLIGQIKAGESISHAQVDSKHCAFGKWFHGAGYVHYGHLDIYDEICELHKGIHLLGAAIARLISRDNSDQVELKIKEMQRRSDQFVEKLELLNQIAMKDAEEVEAKRLTLVQ
jgi:hypothetical protein